MERTNVVLILADYMGYGDIGPTGVPDIRTPYLDRLAAEGVLCTDTTAAAPICSPSRAALLTGRYPARIGLEANVNYGIFDAGLPPAETTVARRLRDVGYDTALFGKWHLGSGDGFDPNAHGFTEFLGYHDWSIDYYSHRMMNGEPGLFHNGAQTTRSGYSTDLFTDETISFIERQRASPFFVFLSFNAALPPHQPPGRPDDLRTAATWNEGTREDYRGVVEAIDANVGRVLDSLQRTGVAERTLVIFTYDHGGKELARGAPFFHGFSTLWEGGIRVPMLLRWPGRLTPGQCTDAQTSLMDLVPTILAATDTPSPPPGHFDGIDLLPVLTEGSAVPQRTLFWRIDFRSRCQQAARRGPLKYIRDVTAEMLFDVRQDPGERDDLAYREPRRLAELREALAGWEAIYPR